jgi:uncharacterized coiled-coil DUF342 family protein
MTPYASIGKLFPVDPTQEEIRDQYNHLRKAAISVNRSRGQYIRQVKERDLIIDKLNSDLRSFASDAQIDFQEKAQLLSILQKYRDVFAKLEKAGDEMVEGVEEYKTGRGTFQGARPFGRLIAACYAFVNAWRAAKDISDIQRLDVGV